VLLDRVRAKIDEKEGELGLQEIKLDHTKVDWPRVVQASVYRRPPFDPGEKEKGFRDALIAESFLQLLEVSPKTPSVCRLVFVTNDQLLSEAVRERIAGLANASVLSGIEELKGLINSVVSNVAEDFIALLKPKAAKMFFVSSDDKDALYYKGEVGEQIRNRFKVQLEAKPEGATFRKNGTWYISAPNFSRKEGRRVFWASRVEVEVEAGNVVKAGQGQYPQIGLTTTLSQLAAPKPQEATGLAKYIDELANPPSFNVGSSWKDLLSQWADSPDTKVVTHKGKDVFEVLWSAEVTMAKDLKKGAVEDIKHVGLGCQAVV